MRKISRILPPRPSFLVVQEPDEQAALNAAQTFLREARRMRVYKVGKGEGVCSVTTCVSGLVIRHTPAIGDEQAAAAAKILDFFCLAGSAVLSDLSNGHAEGAAVFELTQQYLAVVGMRGKAPDEGGGEGEGAVLSIEETATSAVAEPAGEGEGEGEDEGCRCGHPEQVPVPPCEE